MTILVITKAGTNKKARIKVFCRKVRFFFSLYMFDVPTADAFIVRRYFMVVHFKIKRILCALLASDGWRNIAVTLASVTMFKLAIQAMHAFKQTTVLIVVDAK